MNEEILFVVPLPYGWEVEDDDDSRPTERVRYPITHIEIVRDGNATSRRFVFVDGEGIFSTSDDFDRVYAPGGKRIQGAAYPNSVGRVI